MSRKRNYKREYKIYHKKKKQKKDRALRNKARRQAIREGKVHKGDGKDVHHKKGLNDSNNVQIKPKHKNRSFSRENEEGHGSRKKK